MKKENISLIIFLAIATVAFLAALVYDSIQENRPKQIYEVSVITRGKNNEYWESIRKGAEQAATEYLVNLSFITLSEENDLEEQKYLIEREIKSDADALVISATDSEKLGEYMDELQAKRPVTAIESPIGGESEYTYVSSNDYDMGVMLGERIINTGNGHKRITMLTVNDTSGKVHERREGLRTVIDKEGTPANYLVLPSETAAATEQVRAYLEKKETDVLVAMGAATMELTGQVLSELNLQQSISLFGFDATGKIASFVEKGIVQATVVENNFAIGYLGVQSAVEAIEKRQQTKDIIVEHRLVSKKNMYEPEIQQLLFPITR